MSKREFLEMRPGEFWEAMNAYNIQFLAQQKHQGELIRGAVLRLWNVQVNKKDRILDPRKFWPMPWDEMQVGDSELKRLVGLSEAEKMEEANKFFSKINNGKV
jgi:hypothetical protein